MEKRDNSGVAFKNNYKQKPSQPDYKGTAVYKGQEFEIAIWVKEGQNGEFFSMSFQEPYKKEETKQLDAKAYATAEANKMFKRDIEKEYEPEDDGLPF